MKAQELAKLLMAAPDAQVMAWDVDAGGMYPITGLVGDEFKQEVQTDSDEETPFHCDEKLGDRCPTQCQVCAEWERKKRKASR